MSLQEAAVFYGDYSELMKEFTLLNPPENLEQPTTAEEFLTCSESPKAV